MHPRIAELLENLDAHRAELRRVVDSIPPDHHRASPEPGRWSVVNVLEHLSLLESRLTRLFQKRIDEARAAGLRAETDSTSILSQPGLEALMDRSRKMTAPEIVQPVSDLDLASAWEALEAARERLRAVIVGADGLALGEITHPHLAFGTLTLYQWFVFIAGHEARHTAQIREIAADLRRASAAPPA